MRTVWAPKVAKPRHSQRGCAPAQASWGITRRGAMQLNAIATEEWRQSRKTEAFRSRLIASQDIETDIQMSDKSTDRNAAVCYDRLPVQPCVGRLRVIAHVCQSTTAYSAWPGTCGFCRRASISSGPSKTVLPSFDSTNLVPVAITKSSARRFARRSAANTPSASV